MTTKPNNKIFNRDLAIVESKDFINHSSKLLRELVCNSTLVLSRCNECSINSEEDSTIFILYLHIMKMTDGIEVLVSELCLDSAKLLLRSSFEALLSLEFILKSNTKKRALAWLFCYAKNKQKNKKLIISSASEKEDGVIKSIETPVFEAINKEIEKIENYIGRTENIEIMKEYNEKEKKLNKNPQWFQLFEETEKINNLRDLAEHLDRVIQYDILYRDWSTTTHAFNIENYLTTSDSGIIIKPLRKREGITDITNWTAQYILNSTNLILKMYRPEENIDEWYDREIKPLFPMT